MSPPESNSSPPAHRRADEWHPELIKAEVRMRDETLTGLSIKGGLAEDACRDALRTRRPRAEVLISEFIGVPKEELWPDRYPKSGPPTSVDSATPGRTHRQKTAAG